LKTIEGLTEQEKTEVVGLLEMANPKTVSTIKDIRQIDKICTIFENTSGPVCLEDSDFEFMRRRLNDFSGWVPKKRKEILALADKLGL
jgi:hypothetical protein